MKKGGNLLYKSLQGSCFIILFFFFYEMIIPLRNLANIERIDGFLIFILIILTLIYSFKSKLLVALGGFIAIIASLIYLYNPKSLPLYYWFKEIHNILIDSVCFIQKKDFYSLSDEFRSLIFLLILWLIIVVYVYLRKKEKCLWIIIITLSFLSFLNSYFDCDVKLAIVRVVFIGLLFLGIQKQINLNEEAKDYRFSSKVFLFILITIFIIISIGYIMPKSENAEWNNKINFFNSSNSTRINESKKAGFSSDDSYLGGSVESDDKVIMRTISSKRVYWRGESKDMYTGHGWVNSEFTTNSNNIHEINFQDKLNMDYYLSLLDEDSQIKTELVYLEITFLEQGLEQYFFAGDIKQLLVNDPSSIEKIYFNTEINKIKSNKNINNYSLKSEIPVIDFSILRNTDEDYSTDIINVYLQLPDDMARVKELAEDITKNYDNQYDKVIAIRDYLINNYDYDTQNLPYIDQEEDFVDEFLFESKRGYCDHFSSSMVVLARSVGIPARWVKGYTQGDVSYSKETNLFTGIVTNNNAHSWVEIYFNNIGWISFEATPGFRYPQVYNSSALDIEESTDVIVKEEEIEEEQNIIADNDNTNNAEKNKITNLNKIYKYIIFILLLILVSLIVFHKKIRDYFFYRNINKLSTRLNVVRIFDDIFLYLNKNILKRRSYQTIREYFSSINSINSKFGNKEWKDTINLFEKARYSKNEITKKDLKQTIKIWSKITKK